MYLTRMQLDLNKQPTLKGLVSPNLFHGAIEHAFVGERKRNLWRIDNIKGTPYLLLLSPESPNLTAAFQQFGKEHNDSAWETKDYTPLLERIKPGTCWQFRLVANPTKSIKSDTTDFLQRGKVRACVSIEQQKEWLADRADQHGFSLRMDDFTVVHRQWHKFCKGNDNGRYVSLLSVAYEGGLTVTDANLFRETLTQGIGRGKAYGLGLLTIVKC